MIKEYDTLDATALAALIKNKSISPLELLETAIARAEKYNPALNAIIMKFYDYARAHAKNIDINTPFAGVPFLLKDIGPGMQGFPTTLGSAFFQNNIADFDSEIVTRFKKAGFNIFGKTNVPEMGLSYTTEPRFYGATHNPWSLDRTPGGSSGGAAAAVAARIIPVAHASDGGGSIRIPAACCGLFGLKPTRARVSLAPDKGEGWSGMSISHVVSISVRDSAAILDCIAGAVLGDPYFPPPQSEPYGQAIQQKPPKLKIAFATHAQSVEESCQNAVIEAAKLCQSLGHEVSEDYPVYDAEQLGFASHVIISSNAQNQLQSYVRKIGKIPTSNEIEPINLLIMQDGLNFTAVDYANALDSMHRQARKIMQFFSVYDILITPVTAKLPPRLGELTPMKINIALFYKLLKDFAPFATVWNQTGQPAMSVPLYWTQENLPVGVQFVGRFGAEATLFQLAAQLETLKPWRDRKPELIRAKSKLE